jgi:TonB-linked SusC/RagA family outer membrane protein
MKKNAFLLFLFVFVFCGMFTMQAQTRQVTGTVTSAEDGSTIPGASVVVQGTTIGTVTNFDGFYTLSVPATATQLMVSYIGYATREVPINNRTVIDVELVQDVLALEEVVVTALGITRERRTLGYAVQEVGGDDIARSGNPNLLTALSGKVAGLEVRQSSGMPGAPVTMFVRGARSFSGNNQPLYVVDGMPIHSDSDYTQNVTGAYHANRAIDIDPNNIESVSVLKGQSATALYGLRASNGVILITTKSGRGAAPGQPLITFNTGFAQETVARLPELQQLYAQGTGRNFVPVNSFSWGPRITDLPDNATFGGNNHGEPGMFFHPQKNEWVEPRAFNSASDFFENGSTFNNHVNVAHSGAMGNYSIGLGSTHQTGIVTNTGLTRYTGRMSGAMELSEVFTVGFSGNVADTRMDKLPSGNDSWLFTVYGAPPSYDLVGTPFHVPSGPNNEFRQTSYRVGAVGENPLWAVRNNYFTEATQRFFGNAFVQAQPADWVNVRYQLGLDSYSTDQEALLQMGSAGTGQLMPTAAFYPTPDNREYGYRAPTGGEINNFGIVRSNVNSLLNVTLAHDFTDDLGAMLILGNEFVHNYHRTWSMLGTDFTMPGWNNIANTSNQTATETKRETRTVGFYGNLVLDFRNTLFLNVTGRQDVVSTMPRDNRTFFYPSVSLGLVFTEFEALQNNFLQFGKIRASYAEVGQAGNYFSPAYELGYGSWSGYISGVDFPLGGVSGFRPLRTLYDPGLIPQNTRTYEFGAELVFFNNRVGIDYTYADQLARDQIFSVPLAGSTGYGFLTMNAGEMSTQSHEIMLNLTPVRTNNFEWNFSTNFTSLTNVVVELAEGVENISLGGYVTPNIRASAGDTYPAIYGNTFAKDENGNILVIDSPGAWNHGFPQMGAFGKIGDVTPDFIMGFTNTLRFGSVVLSGQLDWKQGGQMYSGSNRLMDLYGTTKKTEDRETTFIFPGVLADGSPNDIVRGGPGDPSAYEDLWASHLSPLDEYHVYGTSFVKLRDVSLAVAIPARLVAPAGIRTANLSLFARNILLWTELPNFDPETAQGMGNMVGGMDYMSLPQTSSFGLGLNLTF